MKADLFNKENRYLCGERRRRRSKKIMWEIHTTKPQERKKEILVYFPLHLTFIPFKRLVHLTALHYTLKTETIENVLTHSKDKFKTETQIQTSFLLVDASTKQNEVWIWVSVFNLSFEWVNTFSIVSVFNV